MEEFEALRRERYEIARSLLDGSYPQDQGFRVKESMDRELLRIQELEEMYHDSKLEADELIGETREEVIRVETAAEEALKNLELLQETVDRVKRNQAKQASSVLSEAEKDSKTYATASTILRERISQARDRLMNLESLIDSHERRAVMRNPQAQELWLQLRALLSAQEKELRSKLRPLIKASGEF